MSRDGISSRPDNDDGQRTTAPRTSVMSLTLSSSSSSSESSSSESSSKFLCYDDEDHHDDQQLQQQQQGIHHQQQDRQPDQHAYDCQYRRRRRQLRRNCLSSGSLSSKKQFVIVSVVPLIVLALLKWMMTIVMTTNDHASSWNSKNHTYATHNVTDISSSSNTRQRPRRRRHRPSNNTYGLIEERGGGGNDDNQQHTNTTRDSSRTTTSNDTAIMLKQSMTSSSDVSVDKAFSQPRANNDSVSVAAAATEAVAPDDNDDDDDDDINFVEELLSRFTLGPFTNQHSWPYISSDFWYDLVRNTTNNNQHYQHHGRRNNIVLADVWPDVDWLSYLDRISRPIVVILINAFDIPYPPVRQGHQHQLNMTVIDHPMLHRLYVYNPSIVSHSKIRPLPVGPKWQRRSTKLFGESKFRLKHEILQQIVGATSPEDTRRLFLSGPNRSKYTVWVRPVSTYRHVTYDNTVNRAIRTPRDKLCQILHATAPNSTVCGGTVVVQDNVEGNNINNKNNNNSVTEQQQPPPPQQQQHVPPEEYWQALQQHRFVTSPPGHGMDSHSTWEALLAGCIPIVPHSALDPMFVDLPVWLIHSWHDEVTDLTIQQKADEMISKVDEYDWEKIYANGWSKLIQADAEAVSTGKTGGTNAAAISIKELERQ